MSYFDVAGVGAEGCLPDDIRLPAGAPNVLVPLGPALDEDAVLQKSAATLSN